MFALCFIWSKNNSTTFFFCNSSLHHTSKNQFLTTNNSHLKIGILQRQHFLKMTNFICNLHPGARTFFDLSRSKTCFFKWIFENHFWSNDSSNFCKSDCPIIIILKYMWVEMLYIEPLNPESVTFENFGDNQNLTFLYQRKSIISTEFFH